MVGAGHSIRLQVELNPKKFTVISYPQLMKQHEKTNRTASSVTSMALDKEQDSYYLGLLKRAAKYDLEPTGDEDSVESGDEDSSPNKDGKVDEYDYDDPFIDDSDMLLDDTFEYSPLEFDGFFVYYGALDGPIIPTAEKKKATTMKERATAGETKLTSSSSSKAAAETKATPPTSSVVMAQGSSQKSYTKAHPIEIYDVEEETDKLSILMNPSSSPIRSQPNTSSLSAKFGMEIRGTNTLSADLQPTANSRHIKSKPINVLPSTNALWAERLSPMPSTPASTMATDFDQSTVSNSPTPGTIVPLILNPLSPRLEALMEQLRHDRQKLSFENKAKFPPRLRPTMLNIGTEMFDTLHQVDDNVVAHLVDILPYNRFTMRKYLVTKSGPAAIDRFQSQIDQLIKVLVELVKEVMPEHIQRYEERLLEQRSDPRDDHLSVERKFRFSSAIRRTLYEVLTLDMYSSSIANEIAQLSNKPNDVVTEKSARRAMYAKLLPCWPQPWMTTYDISRQYSSYKLKMKNSDVVFTTQVSSSPSSSSTADTNRRAPTAVKRSASPMPTALSSSPNVSQWTQMDTCGGDEKRKRLSDTYNSPIAISSDEETEQEAFYDLSHDDHSNIKHLISNTLAEHLNDMTTMGYYNGHSSESSASSTQKSPFMNISSLISKP
ncbi:hypothetical protein [Absidia glauca]|uniref:Ubinuclein middle domain-containing protein n=1 Tax=Absidia glauca TaxID=4829 RepID=A0A168PP22_ABSGL|nr:hypothetical protein [Absidia glauca]